MYLLTAIFNKNCLDDVLHDLVERKIEGITVSEVIGKGGLSFFQERGTLDLDEKVRIEIVVSNEFFKEEAKAAIRENSQDLEHGSGKMWVTPVLEVERIRTGETNEDALRQSGTSKDKNLNDNYFTAVDTPAS